MATAQQAVVSGWGTASTLLQGRADLMVLLKTVRGTVV
jgi:hypothetical protein